MRRSLFFVSLLTSSVALADPADPGKAGEIRRRTACMKASGAKAGCTGLSLHAPRRARGEERKAEAKATRDTSAAPQRPDPDVDPRRTLALSERRFLIREIAQLERLYSQMRRRDPQRPQVVRRLAEGYAELARAAERDANAAEVRMEREEKKPSRKAPKPPARRTHRGASSTSPYPSEM